jgi:hypothetical protein
MTTGVVSEHATTTDATVDAGLAGQVEEIFTEILPAASECQEKGEECGGGAGVCCQGLWCDNGKCASLH